MSGEIPIGTLRKIADQRERKSESYDGVDYSIE